MANIYDYFNRRGDVPFCADPFNEVDNLILSQLAYTDFDCIDGLGENMLDIGKVRSSYFSFHKREETLNKNNLIAQAPILLDYLADSERFGGLRMGFYENIVDYENASQFAALIYELDHMYYIAFRGTDDSIVGRKENFYLSFQENTRSQLLAKDYLNKYLKILDKEVHVGGHSKGGNLAIFAAAFCDEDLKGKIKTVRANDSPGFCEEVIDDPKYIEVIKKVKSFVPKSSVVGRLMEGKDKQVIIKSDAKLILQHQAENRQLKRNRFEREDSLSKESIFIEESIKSRLTDIPKNQRKRVIDSVFACVVMAGYDNFTKFNEDGLQALKRVLEATNMLDKEDSDLIKKLLFELIGTGRKILFDNFKDRLQERKTDILDSRKTD
jgi:hypothetical protein